MSALGAPNPGRSAPRPPRLHRRLLAGQAGEGDRDRARAPGAPVGGMGDRLIEPRVVTCARVIEPMPAPGCSCTDWSVCSSVFSVRLVCRALSSSCGVVVSGQCFCPSRSPRRAGNCEGRGTPLPLCAAVASLAAAARGMAAEVASGGKSIPRVEPLMSSPGARGRRRAVHVLRRAADAARLWRDGSRSSAGIAGQVGDPRHVGSSLAPAWVNPLMAGAFRASSLPAAAVQ